VILAAPFVDLGNNSQQKVDYLMEKYHFNDEENFPCMNF